MNPLHILFMARRFPPSVGGMERFAHDLSVALGQNMKLNLVAWKKQSRLSVIIGLPYLFFKSFWKLLISNDINIIHCQDGASSPLAWLLSKIFQKPYVVMIHGLDMTFKNRFYQVVIPWFVRRANLVIAISEQTRQEAIKRGVSENKIEFIPLGISDNLSANTRTKTEILIDAKLEELSGKNIILTVGRLVKRKGVAWFINEVLTRLYKNNSNVRYVIIGEGNDRPAIEAAIQKNNLEKVVFLLGAVDEDTKQAMYRASDIFIMPNIPVKGDMEGFGIVAHEAAVAGLPVVASKLEGIVNAVHERKNGLLLPPQDSQAYIKTINELLVDKTARRKWGAQARRYTLDQFGWDIIAARYLKLYESVSANKHSRNIKFILSIIILTATFIAFVVYASNNQEVIDSLLRIHPIIVLELIALYFCLFTALLAVLYFSVAFYQKNLSWKENFLVSSYSSLTNFFGPTQTGSGVRALYLKAKVKLKVKDFIFVSLIYYAIYATLSIVLLLAGAGWWLWSLVAASLIAIFSWGVMSWYKKRSGLSRQPRNFIALLGIFIATLMQLFFQSLIYFVEILSINPAVTYAQALSFTGAANFSLFVSLTPGAIGIREAFLLFSQNLHHVSSDIIVSAGVLDRAVYVVFLGLLFLAVITLHGRKKIQELRAAE